MGHCESYHRDSYGMYRMIAPVMLRTVLWPEASLSLRSRYNPQLLVFDKVDRNYYSSGAVTPSRFAHLYIHLQVL